jgi:hypothetical protein
MQYGCYEEYKVLKEEIIAKKKLPVVKFKI